MAVPPPELNRCQCLTAKVLRPDRCVMLDGNLCSACAEDIVLEQELKELEKLVEKIHIKRRALRTAMNQNHECLIHKFPPEIASQIFFHYSLANLHFDTHAKTNTLFLGAVCQKWRQLAWATPELWTSINIGRNIIHQWTTSTEQLFAEWLQRSATLPLSIRFIDLSQSDSVDGVYRVVTDLLNKHSARWYNVHLHLPARHLHHLCSLSQENILHRLAISPIVGSDTFPPSEAALSTFRMKCSPVELRLTSLSMKYVDIMWNNLTVVYLSSLGLDEFFEILRRSPRLTTITLFQTKPPSGTFGVPDTRIFCPRVRSLELVNVRKVVLEQLFDSLYLPSLNKWTLRTCAFPLNAMISFIESSAFCLKTFRTIETCDVVERIHDLLRHLPSIEAMQLGFWFHDGPPAEFLFFELLCSPDETAFLPHLRTLNFYYDLPVPLESLPRIFGASHRRSLRLEVDSLPNIAVIGDETAARFLELVDEGFDLSIWRCGKVDVIEEYRVNRHSQGKKRSTAHE
jgi:hypothetical protein